MQEQSVMEIIKWITGLLLVMFILGVGLFLYEIQDVNTFKQQVNYQIERRGGLTPEAVAELDSYSRKAYQGRYSIESAQLNKHVEFGQKVDYKVVGKFPIKFINTKPIVVEFPNSGYSQVR